MFYSKIVENRRYKFLIRVVSLMFVCYIYNRKFVLSFDQKVLFQVFERKRRKMIARRFVCPTCSRQFTAKRSLNIHMEMHTGKFTYFCEICQKGFSGSTNYKIHMRSHEGLRYYCSYCGKSFASKQSLDYHLSIHTGQYRFTCNVCSKGFNNKIVFEKHTASHS